jgi:hypothetical protein
MILKDTTMLDNTGRFVNSVVRCPKFWRSLTGISFTANFRLNIPPQTTITIDYRLEASIKGVPYNPGVVPGNYLRMLAIYDGVVADYQTSYIPHITVNVSH